jgi:hypothetical protein
MSDNGGKEWKPISSHQSFESTRLSSLELPADSTGKLLLLTSSYQVHLSALYLNALDVHHELR